MRSEAAIRQITKTRAWIAGRHDNPLFGMISRAASMYNRAYNNELNWDFPVNGERWSLCKALNHFQGDILDVGAYVGQWTTMARQVAQDRKIHLFEVSPVNFENLRSNLPKCDMIVANNFGLANKPGQLELKHYVDSGDRSSLIDVDDRFAKTRIGVNVSTGDDYVSTHGVKEIAYLKIDVEGFEMNVLQGFRQSFSSGIIHAVQFEHGVSHVFSGHFLKDFIEFFEEWGYKVYKIFPRHWAEICYVVERDESFAGANYIALKPWG